VPIRLVLVDDHPLVLGGLERLFQEHEEFRVLQCCRNGHEALAAVRKLRPDVLVLDVRMPVLGGIDVLRAMAAERLACRTVVLAAVLRDEEVTALLRLGAMGIVRKEEPSSTLLECVRRAHRGLKSIDPDMWASAFEKMCRESAFTPREVQILGCVAEGLRNREIADRLSISTATVKIHLHNLFEKTGVSSRIALVLYAQERGAL
jgi:DNA-binding NarL/FixJ family response regulator